jgi:hypothetical protein
MTMPGSGFASTFMGMDVVIVLILIARARRLARKWGGQCIIFIDEIDEIDAVGLRRQALSGGLAGGMTGAPSFHDLAPGARSSSRRGRSSRSIRCRRSFAASVSASRGSCSRAA